MDQDPLDLVMRNKELPEDKLLEEIKEVRTIFIVIIFTQCTRLKKFISYHFPYLGSSLQLKIPCQMKVIIC